MKTLTFNLTQAQFDTKLAELAKEVGGDLHKKDATSGTVKHSGVEADYVYSAPTGVLTIEVKHKPFIVPESTIDGKLNEWFKQA